MNKEEYERLGEEILIAGAFSKRDSRVKERIQEVLIKYYPKEPFEEGMSRLQHGDLEGFIMIESDGETDVFQHEESGRYCTIQSSNSLFLKATEVIRETTWREV